MTRTELDAAADALAADGTLAVAGSDAVTWLAQPRRDLDRWGW